jgi:hypothetical protein
MNAQLLKILTQLGLAMKQPDFTGRQFHEGTPSKHPAKRRMGFTKNHSQGESKVRRQLAARSRHINWRYQ